MDAGTPRYWGLRVTALQHLVVVAVPPGLSSISSSGLTGTGRDPRDVVQHLVDSLSQGQGAACLPGGDEHGLADANARPRRRRLSSPPHGPPAEEVHAPLGTGGVEGSREQGRPLAVAALRLEPGVVVQERPQQGNMTLVPGQPDGRLVSPRLGYTVP